MLSKKFSALLMTTLLIATAASLVGITSIYNPANVQAQGQLSQQQQQQQQPQPLQKPQTPQSSITALTPKQALSKLNPERLKAMNQALEDKILLDRLFPQILKRIDGKTLAAKVLPYLDISANVITRDGPTATIRKSTPIIGSVGSSPLFSTAKCNNGETAVGGGFRFDSEPEDSFVSTNIPNIQQNVWYSASQMKVSGKLQAAVTCLTINVGLKNVQQQPSLPPPGGPPLQPPPGSPLVVR
jgi:hypothetical protein